MRAPLTIIFFFICQQSVWAQTRVSSADSARLQLVLKQSQVAYARKAYLPALKQLKLYVYLKDSVLEAVRKQQIEQLQKQFQTAKKDLDIQSQEKNIGLLTSQNELSGKNLRQKQTILKITGGLLAAAALLLIISLWQYYLKRKANNCLQLQQNAINQQNNCLESLAGQKDALLEEKELLIKEIHHRVKNNLQVVISLLNTQSAYLNDAQATQAIRQSQHRMQSISLIHQKLYQSESRALINMQEYIQELVQYLKQSFDSGNRIAFKLKVDDIDLDVLRAVPLALIMNEAITNALKYAFPASSNGYIKIELSCIGGNKLKLLITDNGPGLPPEFSIDLCQSLGINLMKGMCRQLSGRLNMQNENGLLISLEFLLAVPLIDDISPFGDDLQPLAAQFC